MDFINYSDLLTRAPISGYPSVSPLIYLLGASKEGLTCFRMLSLEVFPILQAHHSWWLQKPLESATYDCSSCHFHHDNSDAWAKEPLLRST